MCHRHLNFEQVTVLTGEIIRDSTVRDFKMWPLVVLMVTTLTGFFLGKCMAVLPGQKKEAVRRGSMVVRGSGSGIGSHWSGAQW